MSALDCFVVGTRSSIVLEHLLLIVLVVSVLGLVVVVVLIHSVHIIARHSITIVACIPILIHVALRVRSAIVSGSSCIRCISVSR